MSLQGGVLRVIAGGLRGSYHGSTGSSLHRTGTLFKVASAMVKIPFRHQADESKKRENSGEHQRLHLAEWLRREDEGIERASSSIFLSSHDRPLAPQRTCIQGHEILPGEDHCSHGHPVG